MTCFMCKGDMEDKLTSFMVEVDNKIIIVKAVPSHVCKQCGEVSYSDEVVKTLHRIIQEMKAGTSELVVSTYKVA